MDVQWTDFERADLTRTIIGSAIEVHRVLGPGLLESTYRICLARELELRGLEVEQEIPISVAYKGAELDCGYRADLIVGKAVLLELKSVEKLIRVHEAQILTYLKLANLRIGLLLNFNEPTLKDGIRRFVR